MIEFKIFDRAYPDKESFIKKKILKQTLISITTNGWSETTLDVITSKSKCSIRAFYKNFNNKEHVVATLFKIAIDDLFIYRQTYLFESMNFEESIYALVLAYIDWVVDHPALAKILLSKSLYIYLNEYNSEIIGMINSNRQSLLNWMSQYKDSEVISKNMSLDLYATFINGHVEYYCKHWLLGRITESPKKHRKEIAYAAWNSLKNFEKNCMDSDEYTSYSI